MHFTSRTRRGASRTSAIVVAVILTACTGSAARPATGVRTESVTASKDRLDSAQLNGRNYGSLHQAIVATHPDWLSPTRPSTSLATPGKPVATPAVGVFMDGSHRSQGVDFLKQIKVETVRSVRHMSASESRAEFGADWQYGAILVTTIR